MTRQVQRLLKERKTAFRSGNKALYSSAHAQLKRGIREAKSDYKKNIEDHLHSNNSRQESNTSPTSGPTVEPWRVMHHWQRS